jgi:hypothetical protein
MARREEMRAGSMTTRRVRCGGAVVAASRTQLLLLLLVAIITLKLPVFATAGAARPSGAAWIVVPTSRSSSFTVSTLQRRGPGGTGVIASSNWILFRPSGPATTVLPPDCLRRRLTTATALELSPPWSDAMTNLLLAAETESWRQYVPLAVCLFVIVDILLGSPAANSVLGLMRPKEDETVGKEEDDEGQTATSMTSSSPFGSLMQGGGGGNNTRGRRGRNVSSSSTKSKERIDTQAVAQAALDKASATLELRKFLNEGKSDWDKMREIQQKMDDDLSKFDETIERQRTEWEKEVREIKKEQ